MTEHTSRRSALAAGAGLCLLGGAGWFARPERRGSTDRVAVVDSVDRRGVSAVATDDPLVGLTFDDGPDPAYTPQVLEILAEGDVRATFFLIGRAAAQHPDLVQEVVRAGHAVANHTQDHLWLTQVPEAVVRDEMERGQATLDALGLRTHHLFRPPRGLTSPTVAAVAASLHLTSIFWGTCLEANLSHHGVVEAATITAERTHPGAIVLCHDGGHLDGPNPQSIDRTQTVEGLPTLIEGVRAQGLEFATLPDLIARRR